MSASWALKSCFEADKGKEGSTQEKLSKPGNAFASSG